MIVVIRCLSHKHLSTKLVRSAQQRLVLRVQLNHVAQAGEPRGLSPPPRRPPLPLGVSADLQVAVHVLADASVEGVGEEQHHHVPQREHEDVVAQVHRRVDSVLLRDEQRECKRSAESRPRSVGSLRPACPRSARRTPCP